MKNFQLDNPKNNQKNIAHAFFLSLAITIAEPSTVLPLMVVALDGFNIAGMNLLIEIAPEAKRPLYTALQTNISSLGLFFPIIGGVILTFVGSYSIIYGLTIALLLVGFGLSLRLGRG